MYVVENIIRNLFLINPLFVLEQNTQILFPDFLAALKHNTHKLVSVSIVKLVFFLYQSQAFNYMLFTSKIIVSQNQIKKTILQNTYAFKGLLVQRNQVQYLVNLK